MGMTRAMYIWLGIQLVWQEVMDRRTLLWPPHPPLTPMGFLTEKKNEGMHSHEGQTASRPSHPPLTRTRFLTEEKTKGVHPREGKPHDTRAHRANKEEHTETLSPPSHCLRCAATSWQTLGRGEESRGKGNKGAQPNGHQGAPQWGADQVGVPPPSSAMASLRRHHGATLASSKGHILLFKASGKGPLLGRNCHN